MSFDTLKHSVLSVICDADFLRGATGTTMAIVFPSLTSLTHLVQVIGALLGVILVTLSIYHKILEIKRIKDDRDKRTRKH